MKELQKKNLRFDDADFYIRTNITGLGGTIDLIDESTNKKYGVVNFDKAELPSLQNLILKGLKGGFTSKATASDATDADVVRAYTTKMTNIDPALYGAEIIVEQEDKPLLIIPVQRLFSEEVSRGPAGGEDSAWLNNWRWIKHSRKFALKLRFPAGKSVASDKQYYFELHLLGDMTRIKG